MNPKEFINKFINNPIVLFCSIIIDIVSIIFGFITGFDANIILIAVLIASLVIIIIAIITMFKLKRIQVEHSILKDETTVLKSSKKILESLVEDGRRFISNSVHIKIDPVKLKYYFEFEKKYEIITDYPSSFINGQFYCNKYLGNKDKAIEFYDSNQISWSSLNFSATIKSLPPDRKRYTQAKSVLVVPVAARSNHIPYRVYYKNIKTDADIPIVKGTFVVLKYCYEISAELWGSYLNRTLSYFEEEAAIVIEYPFNKSDKKEFKVDVSYLNEKKNDNPEEVDDADFEITYDDFNHSYRKCTINLPRKSGRFRIHWQTEEIFDKIQTTKNLVDDLEVTNE